MFYFTLSLYVILASGKIPHEISPVHVVQLVDKEELDVIPLGRDFHHHHLSRYHDSDRAFFARCCCPDHRNRGQLLQRNDEATKKRQHHDLRPIVKLLQFKTLP